MNLTKGFFFLLLVCVLGAPRRALPEEIRGVVTDPSGAVIQRALVELKIGDRVIAATATDSAGIYALHVEHEQASSGMKLSVSARGFKTSACLVHFAPTQAVGLSVQLEVEQASERVDVEAKTKPFGDQLDMTEVRNSTAKDVGEALAAVDGVYRLRKAGIANDVVVRGFQQNNVNVLINGARIYGACPGHMDPAVYHVDFAEVERVDVAKGAFNVASAGSLGATVNVITKRSPLGLRVTPSMSAGSFGYYNPSITASYGNERIRFLAGYSYRQSDPYKDGSGRSFLDASNYNMAAHDQHAFEINTGWFETEFTSRNNQRLTLDYTRQQSGLVLYPYETMDSDYDHADRASLKYGITNPTDAIRSIRAQIYFTQVIHFMSDRYRTTAMMNTWMMAADARSRAIGGHLEADIWHGLTLGLESYYRNWNVIDYMNMSGMLSSTPALPDVATRALGAFAEYDHSLSNRLKFSGGVRIDHDSMSTGTPGLNTNNYFYYHNTRGTEARDSYGSGNARLTFSLAESFEFFAGVGTSGRVPDAEERYLNYTTMMSVEVGNPDLPRVRNTEFSVGAVFRHGSSYIKPSAFYSKLNDYILVNNQPLQNLNGMMPSNARSYTNVDARIYGGEITYAFRLPSDFSLSGGGSYARGASDLNPLAGVLDSNLPEMPPLRFRAALRYTHKFGFAELGGTAVARQGLIDKDLNESATAGYASLDLKLELKYWKISASLAVDNLLNRDYVEHLSYFRDPFSSGVRVPEPGRNLFVQLRVNF